MCVCFYGSLSFLQITQKMCARNAYTHKILDFILSILYYSLVFCSFLFFCRVRLLPKKSACVERVYRVYGIRITVHLPQCYSQTYKISIRIFFCCHYCFVLVYTRNRSAFRCNMFYSSSHREFSVLFSA